MTTYSEWEEILLQRPVGWLVTEGAGFIGSHLVQRLLSLRQRVVVIDNFSTGSRSNLDQVRALVGQEAAKGLVVVEGNLEDLSGLLDIVGDIDVVLHQAALGSVPRSVADPVGTHRANVGGTFKLLETTVRAGRPRVVFASSSSVYGDDRRNPRVEDQLGRPLSPYAASKRCGELYMEAFASSMGLTTVSLRYFNVFGPRQSPEGAYAAVIPRWIRAAFEGETP